MGSTFILFNNEPHNCLNRLFLISFISSSLLMSLFLVTYYMFLLFYIFCCLHTDFHLSSNVNFVHTFTYTCLSIPFVARCATFATFLFSLFYFFSLYEEEEEAASIMNALITAQVFGSSGNSNSTPSAWIIGTNSPLWLYYNESDERLRTFGEDKDEDLIRLKSLVFL